MQHNTNHENTLYKKETRLVRTWPESPDFPGYRDHQKGTQTHYKLRPNSIVRLSPFSSSSLLSGFSLASLFSF